MAIHKARPNLEFSERLELACEGNSHVPEPNFGRLRWFSEKLEERFSISRTQEGVRKWFDGLTLPRRPAMTALAELLEVDRAWLSDGTAPNLDLRERKLRNAEADGAVNVVAGFIQMAGANPAFPAADDQQANAGHIDLYAIIRGAQYAFHIVIATEVDSGFRFSVPVGANDSVVIGLIRREGFAVDLLELDIEGLAAHGKRKGAAVDLQVNSNYMTENHAWKRIESFATRL